MVGIGNIHRFFKSMAGSTRGLLLDSPSLLPREYYSVNVIRYNLADICLVVVGREDSLQDA